MKIKNIVIGAGISGIVIAEQLANKGEDVLIIEQRNHIGGNCYDYYNENGILIHKYGPHIFHTNIKEVRDYVNKFSNFNNFQHKVIGFVDGNLIPIPFNINSLYGCFSKELSEKIEHSLLENYDFGERISINQLRKDAQIKGDKYLSLIAEYIFEKIFKNYTIKQRNIPINEIDIKVLDRVPIIISKDNRYFPDDKYQGMPTKGYTNMFQKMLKSEKIKILTNTAYSEIKKEIFYDKLWYTGSIDSFFNYEFGKLPYKKTLYKMEEYNINSFQENVVINYPNDHIYTRITEFKKFYPSNISYKIDKTIICKEVPGQGNVDAYPIASEENSKILKKYKEKAENLNNVLFLGRLGEYSYYNMDKAILNILDLFKQE